MTGSHREANSVLGVFETALLMRVGVKATFGGLLEAIWADRAMRGVSLVNDIGL